MEVYSVIGEVVIVEEKNHSCKIKLDLVLQSKENVEVGIAKIKVDLLKDFIRVNEMVH